MSEPRLVYQISGMSEISPRSVVYHTNLDSALAMDLYYPPNLSSQSELPVLLFVSGFPDSVIMERRGRKLKDAGQYVSWAQLVAASGMVAITYETNHPEIDVLDLLSYIRQESYSLGIDANRIGLWACSGNVPTALSILMQAEIDYLKRAVLYYGFTIDAEDSDTVAQASAHFSFAYSGRTKTFDNIPRTIPLFIVRAGHDSPTLNENLDHFLREVIRRNVSITFVNNAEGQHAFDILDDNPRSREIIEDTLIFVQRNLINELSILK